MAGLLIAACGSSTKTASTTTAAAGTPTTTAAPGATTGGTTAPVGSSILNGEIKCTQQYKGKEVHILSPVVDSANDHPIPQFVGAYKPLADCTGVKIVWEGTKNFEQDVNVRLEGGNAPDVIDFPQPGLLASSVAKGYLFPLPDDIAAHTKSDFISGWDVYSTVNGKVYGMPGRSNVKSLVWYSPKAFTAGGYKVPTTLEEMKALSDKLVTDKKIPWCVGAASGVATGWVLTDWIEDFMLRINGEKVYDQWVNHQIPFNDPKVKAAVDAVGAYVKNPDYLGGDALVKAIATTKFEEGGLPILSGNCYMHRQASFYSTLWPKGTNIAPDGDIWFFYLPSPANGPKYLLGAGDIYAAGTNKPESMDVVRYTGSVDYQQQVLDTRKELSPNKNIDTSKITDPFLKAVADLQKNADVFRFDGSDQMPGAVGAGTFWTEVTAWVVGESTDAFLNNVEKSWPKS
ncbi:MAG: ABC transporter substrate-binding protein [Ilumatobacteraceae bacterium]